MKRPFLPALCLLFITAVPVLAVTKPAHSTHLVKARDTLTAIARNHGVSVADIQKTNNLKSEIIRVGQVLAIPSANSGSQTADAPSATKVTEAGRTDPLTASLATLSTEDRLSVQIFLDRELFAPGKVDGLPGEFTRKAALRWMGAASGRNFETLLAKARDRVPATIFTHVIPSASDGFIGPVPKKLEEKAQTKSLPYARLAELLAERYHTDLGALRRLNPGLDLAGLRSGDKIVVPAVNPFRIEAWPDPSLHEIALPGASLRIRHAERLLEVVDNQGALVAVFPVTVGAKPEHLRTGEWSIRYLTPNPTFLWDERMLKEGKAGPKKFLLPPGPNNPVGILWMEIEPLKGPEAHIGIHGTNDSARIGRNHSSGCIRLANWDVVRLARLVGKGTRVTWSGVLPEGSALAMRQGVNQIRGVQNY